MGTHLFQSLLNSPSCRWTFQLPPHSQTGKWGVSLTLLPGAQRLVSLSLETMPTGGLQDSSSPPRKGTEGAEEAGSRPWPLAGTLFTFRFGQPVPPAPPPLQPQPQAQRLNC